MKKFGDLRAPVLARPGAAERIARHRAEMVGQLTLAELREARERTQKQLAEDLETTQSGVSRIEHETDLYVSTLRKYVEALGGRLLVQAVFPNTRVTIQTFADVEHAVLATSECSVTV
ncbi:MAG TPA: helix-turn-helix domain-containing protein [Chloroflexota bacterium]|nr:helix-turn-helix domain-containing protein [Chloroflexota bacterium]